MESENQIHQQRRDEAPETIEDLGDAVEKTANAHGKAAEGNHGRT